MRVFCTFILLLSIKSFGFGSGIEWQTLQNSTFKQAAQEHKIILLNLEANWCHWCHVMENETYANPEVAAYISEHFIAVKADQDANPELSNRYKNYGWPATIFINAKGEDVVKRAGYIAPKNFLRLLKAIVKDPSPEAVNTSLINHETVRTENPKLQKRLQDNFIKSLDFELGGFDQAQKYVGYDTYEYAVFESQDKHINQWIKSSVEGAKKLSDPAWGGIYQYSTHHDWEHLHFEKLLSIQARYISVFLLNYYYNDDENSLNHAKTIVQYADRFLLQGNGLYSNAQDADLIQGEHSSDYFALSNKKRLELGIPKIDTNAFTDNNAAMGIALLRLYRATNNDTYLNKALKIKTALLKRKTTSGLFSHNIHTESVKSLRDQIAMTEFLVELVKNDITDTQSQNELKALCKTIQSDYVLENGSLKSFVGTNGLVPQPLVEENIKMARLFNWYGHYAHTETYTKIAKGIYRFLISDRVSDNYYSEPALLMLEKELQDEPTQYVFLNRNTGNDFSNTIHVMLPFYSIIYDGTLNQLPSKKQELINGFDTNVLLMCTSTYCSSPIFSEKEFKNQLKENKPKPNNQNNNTHSVFMTESQ